MNYDRSFFESSRGPLKQLFFLREGDEVERKGGHEDWSLEWAVNDPTGYDLDGKAVIAARRKEMGYIHDKKVRRKISREEAKKSG